MKLSYPVPRTPDGRVYRFSPNEDAHPRHFVLGEVVAQITLTSALRERMKLDPGSDKTVCPYSGTVAESSDFVHPDDVKAALEMVEHDAVLDVEDALSEMLKNAFGGSSSSNGLIKITASVNRSTPRPKPRFGRQDLMRELVCDHCGRDYGVFAISLFCPDCGAPNLRLHFVRESELVDHQVSLAEEIAADKQELAYRLLGNAHEDVLTAFEATLKTVYLHGMSKVGSNPLPKVGNDFQNVEKAQKRFEELSIDPFSNLTDLELDDLRLNIQKRHVIGHNLGLVDDKFANHDSDAKIGETVDLVGEDIRKFAAISQKAIDNLDTWLGGSPSPTIQSLGLPMTQESATSPVDPNNLMLLDLELSLLARKVGVWTAKNCNDGRANFVDVDEFRNAFPEPSEGELQEAIAELATDGFVKTAGMLSHGIQPFYPTLDLYLTFDGPAFGRDPMADAVTVTELVLAGSDNVNAEDIFRQTGWDIRRFNPIFEFIASQIPDGRVSHAYGSNFSVLYFCLMPEDRVRLKRLISRLGR